MYDQLAKMYYRYFDIRKREYQKLLAEFDGKSSILDIACGIGDFAVNDPKRIMGIDHNKASLSIAKKRGCTVTFGDVLKLPFKKENFEGVFCAHLIEHFDPKDAMQLLSEMSRVLRKGGVLVIQTPLLHKGFYNDFTHEKVYAPEAIMHYLSKTKQTNHAMIAEFSVKKLEYRYAEFFVPLLEPSRRPPSLYRTFLICMKVLSILAYFSGIKNYFSLNGYTLVLEKK